MKQTISNIVFVIVCVILTFVAIAVTFFTGHMAWDYDTGNRGAPSVDSHVPTATAEDSKGTIVQRASSFIVENCVPSLGNLLGPYSLVPPKMEIPPMIDNPPVTPNDNTLNASDGNKPEISDYEPNSKPKIDSVGNDGPPSIDADVPNATAESATNQEVEGEPREVPKIETAEDEAKSNAEAKTSFFHSVMRLLHPSNFLSFIPRVNVDLTDKGLSDAASTIASKVNVDVNLSDAADKIASKMNVDVNLSDAARIFGFWFVLGIIAVALIQTGPAYIELLRK